MADGIWRPEPPATKSALETLSDQAPVRLPAAYLSHLPSSNGGEGDLGVEPGWITFWPAEVVMSLNKEYSIAEFLPGFLGFGSNGGEELLAFDGRSNEPYPIVMVPFVPMEIYHAVRIAQSIDELLDLVGRSCHETS